MLCHTTMIELSVKDQPETIKGKNFKVTDVEGSQCIFLKDDDGKEYVIEAKENALRMHMFSTNDDRIDYLEDMVVTLLDVLGISEEDFHERTAKRLYGSLK